MWARVTPLLEFLGYVPGAVNTPEALDGLRFAFVFLPIIAMLIGAALMFRFPLTRERQQELRRQGG